MPSGGRKALLLLNYNIENNLCFKGKALRNTESARW